MKQQELLSRAREALSQAGCDTPALDAELLAAHVLEVDRSRVLMAPERELTAAEQERFRQLVERRARREPLPYILGEWEFFGLKLFVSPAALVPRPETETLVEACLARLPEEAPQLTGVDVGCGSGAIAVALATALSGSHLLATDSAAAALELARRNCARHGTADRVTLLQGDLLAPLSGQVARGGVDFIAANLPYIPSGEIAGLPPEVHDWEPRGAIDGGPDGLREVRRLIAAAPEWLKPGGFIALEISPEQAQEVRRILAAHDFVRIEVVNDLSGRARVVVGGG